MFLGQSVYVLGPLQVGEGTRPPVWTPGSKRARSLAFWVYHGARPSCTFGGVRSFFGTLNGRMIEQEFFENGGSM
jgi:hypothetical protein